jgi:hypothetical protein
METFIFVLECRDFDDNEDPRLVQRDYVFWDVASLVLE